MSPQRIRMTRRRAWRVDHPDAVIVARPSQWGNPFRVEHRPEQVGWVVVSLHSGLAVGTFPTKTAAAEYAVWAFRTMNGSRPAWIADAIAELRGRDLACWCPLDQACHADVLLELVNGDGRG